METNERLDSMLQELFTNYSGVNINNFDEFFNQPPGFLKDLSEYSYELLKFNDYIKMSGNRQRDIRSLYRLTALLLLGLMYTSQRLSTLENPPEPPE